MELKIVNYHGVHCLELNNGTVKLLVTSQFGPRVLFYGFINGQNLFKEFPEQLANPTLPEWQNYGGHRLWHAPEAAPRSYFPDNAPVPYQWDGTTLTLDCPEETINGLKKVICIKLAASGTKVNLTHKIFNTGRWAVEFSAWCLSVMAPGGRAIVPQEKFVAHGSAYGESLLPARPLVLWQYTKMNDPRFIWGEKYIQLKESANPATKQKFGVLNKTGWLAYALNGEVFVKYHDYEPGVTYPDMGCNAEIFTMPGFLEVEALSALKKVEPGECNTLNEVWELHHAEVGEEEADIDKKLLPLIKG